MINRLAPARFIIGLQIALIVALLFIGCSDDDPATPADGIGTINITSTPSQL